MDNRAINFNRETGKANTTKNLQTTTIAGAKSTRLAQLQAMEADFESRLGSGRYSSKNKSDYSKRR